MVKYAALAWLVFVTGVTQADIYSYRAPDGSIVFTDQPTKGAESVKILEPMTVPAIRTKSESRYRPENESTPMWPEPQSTALPARSDSESVPAYDDSINSSSSTSWSSETQGISTGSPDVKKKSPVKSEEKAYKKLRIVSPTEGSARWVGGELTVEVSLKPGLQPEHVLSLRVDGREVAVGPEMQVVIPDIERGGHTVRAAVLDVNTGKQLIVSDSVKFQIHRPNKNQPSRMLHPSVRKKNSN